MDGARTASARLSIFQCRTLLASTLGRRQHQALASLVPRSTRLRARLPRAPLADLAIFRALLHLAVLALFSETTQHSSILWLFYNVAPPHFLADATLGTTFGPVGPVPHLTVNTTRLSVAGNILNQHTARSTAWISWLNHTTSALLLSTATLLAARTICPPT